MEMKPSTLLTHTSYGYWIHNTEVKVNYFSCLAQIALYTNNIPLVSCNYFTSNSLKNYHLQMFFICIMYYAAEAMESNQQSISHCHTHNTCTLDDNPIKQYYMDTCAL